MKPFATITPFFLAIWFFGSVHAEARGEVYPIEWQTVEIRNTTQKIQEYWLESNRHAFMDLYFSIDEGDTLHKRSGRMVPYKQRDLPFDGRVIISVVLKPGQLLLGKVRLETQLFVGPMPVGKPIKVSIREIRERQLWQFRTFHIVSIGILFLFFVYNLVLFISTRFSRYRYYLPGIVAMILETAREGGLIISLFPNWESYPETDNYLGGVANFAIILSGAMTTRDILDFPNSFPKLDRFFRHFPLISVGGLVITLVNLPAGYSMTKWGLPVVVVAMIGMTLSYTLRKQPYGLILFVGFSLFLIFEFIYWAGTFNIFYIQDDLRSPFLSTGTIVLDIFLTIVLGMMVWNLRKQNAEQQQRIIDDLQQDGETRKRISIAVAKAQEEVRQKFAQRLKRDLEGQLNTIRENVSQIGTYESPENPELQALYHKLSLQTKTSIAKTRKIAHELMPEDLIGSAGLDAAIEEYLNQIGGENLSVEFFKYGDLDIPLPIRALAYRIVRSLVGYQLQQGEAENVVIRLSDEAGKLSIQIQHDSIDPPGYLPNGFQEIVETIRPHVSLYRGTVSVVSGPGTTIQTQITIPTT